MGDVDIAAELVDNDVLVLLVPIPELRPWVLGIGGERRLIPCPPRLPGAGGTPKDDNTPLNGDRGEVVLGDGLELRVAADGDVGRDVVESAGLGGGENTVPVCL